MRLLKGYGARIDGAADAHTPSALADTVAFITPAMLGISAMAPSFGNLQLSRTDAAAATTPTVAQFLNAANAEYVINGVPGGMHHLTYFGIPVSFTDTLTGMSAQAWVTPQHQVVIAYEGTTGGENLLTNPFITVTQIIADIGIYSGTITPAEKESLGFANFVAGVAGQEGYSTSNIFVTGHSLGGIEAEYVASQTGLGGIGFEPTGLPATTWVGNGQNFVNIVTDGDPVGNYASDVRGEQPFAPAYVSRGGILPHYGAIVTIGNASDQATLSQDAAQWGDGNLLDQLDVVGNLAQMLANFHLPGTQAHDLGVQLDPYSQIVDSLGVQNEGGVFKVPNDTISQLIAAAAAHGNLTWG